MAGFAGALAFVWIIVTVWLQSKELAAQREVLRLTRDEMEEQRKATQDMARALEAQAAIFEDEKRNRDEAKAQAELEEILKLLAVKIRRYLQTQVMIPSQYLYTFWLWHGDPDEEDVFKVEYNELAERYKKLSSMPDEKLIAEFNSRLELFVDEEIDLRFWVRPSGTDIDIIYKGFQYLEDALQKLEELKPRLSRAQMHRLSRIGSVNLKLQLSEFVRVTK